MHHHIIMKKHGKRYAAAAEAAGTDAMTIEDAVTALKQHATAKFDEAVEVHMRLSVDPKKSDENVRAAVTLPHGTGKAVRVAVITTSQAKEAQAAGADIVGGEELIAKITDGSFLSMCDVLVATPEMMPRLAPVAKILGPRGMMPSPKAETVTTNVAATVGSLKKGKVEFRSDKGSNIHQVIGRASFEAAALVENYQAFVAAVEAAKPAGVKGKLVLSVTVCSTMGPGIRVK